jgi:putative transposase
MEKNNLNRAFSKGQICAQFNLKRDAYYKFKKRYLKKKEVETQVLKLVKSSRQILPREGTRKLLKSLKPEFQKHNLKIGRDQLYHILREHNLLIRRKKYSCKTTQSHHRFYKYDNIIKHIDIHKPNQVWASDITYIRTVKGFCYLALITDLYSRKIVGYDLSDSLELSGCVKALKKALYHNPNINGLIHHSDRGIQYCSNVYTNELKKKKITATKTQ